MAESTEKPVINTLAYQMDFKKIISPQLKSCPQSPQGVAKYILSNPKIFSSRTELLPKIGQLAKSQHSSRPLIIEGIGLFTSPILNRDHTGEREEWIYHCAIANRQNEKSAVDTTALVKNIESNDGYIIPTPDNSFLKWVGITGGYSKTILPEMKASFDLLCISKENPNYVYLHNANYNSSQNPIIKKQGIYSLKYNVLAEGFYPLELKIRLSLTGNINTTTIELEN